MIYFFTKGDISAGSSRHRAFLVSKYLNKNNVKSKVIAPPVFQKDKNIFIARLSYLITIFLIKKSDTVILQTTIFNPFFIKLIKLVKKIKGPQIIFDFDDAIYINNFNETKQLIDLSNKVIVASHFLASIDLLKDKPVLIFNNLIDDDQLGDFNKISINEKLTLGWIGNAPQSVDNLKILGDIFSNLLAKNIDFKFVLIGSKNNQEVKNLFSLQNLDVSFVEELDWSKEFEIQKNILSFDVGLVPLIDNEDNKARCSLKLLDYMSVGLPVIASAVGENNFLVKNNETGFLVSNKNEWVVAIEKFYNAKNLILEMGHNSKASIKNNFNYSSQINKYINFINS